jgi:hypothetical protein
MTSSSSQSSIVLRFPARRSACIWMLRDGPGWLVLAGENGWLHGSSVSALEDAGWLAKNFRLPLRIWVST